MIDGISKVVAVILLVDPIMTLYRHIRDTYRIYQKKMSLWWLKLRFVAIKNNHKWHSWRSWEIGCHNIESIYRLLKHWKHCISDLFISFWGFKNHHKMYPYSFPGWHPFLFLFHTKISYSQYFPHFPYKTSSASTLLSIYS